MKTRTEIARDSFDTAEYEKMNWRMTNIKENLDKWYEAIDEAGSDILEAIIECKDRIGEIEDEMFELKELLSAIEEDMNFIKKQQR